MYKEARYFVLSGNKGGGGSAGNAGGAGGGALLALWGGARV